MGKTLIAVLVLAGALYLTNPGQHAHEHLVASSFTAQTLGSDFLGKLTGNWLEDKHVLPLKYENYYLFSKTTLNGKTMSFGVLTKVWLSS